VTAQTSLFTFARLCRNALAKQGGFLGNFLRRTDDIAVIDTRSCFSILTTSLIMKVTCTTDMCYICKASPIAIGGRLQTNPSCGFLVPSPAAFVAETEELFGDSPVMGRQGIFDRTGSTTFWSTLSGGLCLLHLHLHLHLRAAEVAGGNMVCDAPRPALLTAL
jgi:hypothetical protein